MKEDRDSRIDSCELKGLAPAGGGSVLVQAIFLHEGGPRCLNGSSDPAG